MPSVEGIVPMEGIIQTKVVLDSQICFLTVQSKNEHGVRVVHIKPTFLMSNLTGDALFCAPLSVVKIQRRVNADKLEYIPQDIGMDDSSATPLLYWQIIGEQPTLFDGMQHVALCTSETEWSVPLNLEDLRNVDEDKRSSVFMDKKSADCGVRGLRMGNVALLLTTHHRDGQVFFVVSKNDAPAIMIHNCLAVPVRYGQSMRNYGNLEESYLKSSLC